MRCALPRVGRDALPNWVAWRIARSFCELGWKQGDQDY